MKAIVFTAGIASRFRPQSQKIAKPLMPFWGVPLFLYGYSWLKELGVNNFIFNLHHLANQCEETIKSYIDNPIFSNERDLLLGSAGALYKAKSYLEKEDSFFVMNGDEVFFQNSAFKKSPLNFHSESKALATLFVCKHPEAGKKFGAIWLDENNLVKHIGKSTIKSKNLRPMHYIGAAILNNEVLKYTQNKETNIFYDLLLPLIQEGKKVNVVEVDCDWFEVGNKEDFIGAHKFIFQNKDRFLSNLFFKDLITKYLEPYNIENTDKYYAIYPKHLDLNLMELEGFIFIDKSCKQLHVDRISNSALLTDNLEQNKAHNKIYNSTKSEIIDSFIV